MSTLFPVPAPQQPDGPVEHSGGGEARCRRCHRRLTDQTSLGYHIGPRCRELLGITTQSGQRWVRAPARPVSVPRRPVPGQAELPLGLDAGGSDDGDGQEGDGECGDQDSPFCSSSFFT